MNDRHKLMEFLSVLLCIFVITTTTIINSVNSVSSPPFIPADNFLIDCGSPTVPVLPDGRVFKSDPQSTAYLSSKDDKKISVPSADVPSPIYLTARIFSEKTTYSFTMTRPGWHWIRLHFFPMNNTEFDLTKSSFSVTTDELVLLHSFQIDNSTMWVMKEYIVNVTNEHLNINFSPLKNSFAFINGIEVVSAPDSLISDLGSSLIPIGDFNGLSTKSYQTLYRLNMGGPLITPTNDTLGRFWEPDEPFLKARALAKTVSVSPGIIQYPEGLSPIIAPPSVYASAIQMADSRTNHPNFNVTWGLEIDPAFGYLIRLHFCDIVSKSLNDLYFNVYINGYMAISGLDLSTLTSDLAVPYYKDYVVNASVLSDNLQIQIGPFKQDTGSINAILNGLEVLKMSNSVGSLDGEFGVDGSKAGGKSSHTTVAAVGFGLMFGAFVGLGAMVFKWYRRPQDWQRSKSFSSWLLPLHAGNSTFMTSKHSSKSGYPNFYSSTMGLGRYFSFAELQEATKNFDESQVIGVGGFGNVYIGDLDDGTKVACKRGNPQSEQGITEFQTEIQMLSKLRHRHLVSLIGYCDENSEMILVYEFMSNGPLRDHLYGKDFTTPLSWKQRLEICIGAARGLHYLHTGAAQGIIHRDVKTTNILLDENLVAKMADFGLSKNAPTMGQGHVSTAVKGSFGYLDPEYFRRQQLTDKSDVYSFGVVLFEVLCARPALNPQLPREQVNLAEWAMQWKRKGLLEKIVDPHVASSINPESMKKFAEAAEKCLAEYGVDRPTMGDVLWNLEYALQLHEASSQGKAEEENKAIVTPTPSSMEIVSGGGPAEDPRPVSVAGENNRNPAQVQAVTEHSGTVMFAEMSELSGR